MAGKTCFACATLNICARYRRDALLGVVIACFKLVPDEFYWSVRVCQEKDTKLRIPIAWLFYCRIKISAIC